MRIIMFIILSLVVAVCIAPRDMNALSEKEEPTARVETAKETDTMPRTDEESIAKGKTIFDAKCGFCHKANSTEKTVGPGLKGIMKGERLLASKKPATLDNIVDQMKNPYKAMPSFAHLPEEDILNILAYLNTL